MFLGDSKDLSLCHMVPTGHYSHIVSRTFSANLDVGRGLFQMAGPETLARTKYAGPTAVQKKGGGGVLATGVQSKNGTLNRA